MFDLFYSILIWAPGILFAVVLHEWAHGYVADRFGDPTPRLAGRLTLNPLPHIDPVMTFLLPVMMLATSLMATGQAMVFGGARPVPIDPRYFPRKQMRLALFSVAFAGPGMNLLLALLCALLFHAVAWLPHWAGETATRMLVAALQMNVLLLVFNLFPLPPLDGGRIATVLLPEALARPFASLERYGLIILLVLLFSGALGEVLWPVKQFVMGMILQVTGVTG